MQNDEFTPRQIILGCLGLLLIPLIIVVFFSIKTVSPGEAAVVTRFGSLQGVRLDGIHVALMEGYTYYDLRTKRVDAEHETGSKDGQFIFVDTAFSYNLKSADLPALFSEVGSQEALELKFIVPVIRDTVYQVAAQYAADEILPKQSEFRGKIFDSLKERMNQEYIDIVDLQIIDIDFTSEYNAVLESKQIAEQNAVKERQVSEQNLEKQKIDIQAGIAQKNFELEAAKIDAEKNRLLQQSLAPNLVQKMWIEKWNGILPTTLSGSDIGLLLGMK